MDVQAGLIDVVTPRYMATHECCQNSVDNFIENLADLLVVPDGLDCGVDRDQRQLGLLDGLVQVP